MTAALSALQNFVAGPYTHLPFVSEMPHGGSGHSGHGQDLSVYGFEEYTRVKHVMSFLG